MPEFNESSLRERNHGMFNLRNRSAMIVGCGTIGSFTASGLVRSGIGQIILVDPDKVEAHNLGVQDYSLDDIGRDKVYALHKRLININPTLTCFYENRKFQEISTWGCDFLIMAMDSMEQRKEVMESLYEHVDNNPIVIDARMGSEVFQMYSFDNNEKSKYDQFMETYYSDDDSDAEPCSARSTAYCGYIAGAFITSEIKKWSTTGCITTKKMVFSFPTLTLKPTINIPNMENLSERHQDTQQFS